MAMAKRTVLWGSVVAAVSGLLMGCPDATPGPVGSGGGGAEGPVCAGGLTCGDTSCCTTMLVPGGTFPMGRSASGGDACPGGAYDGVDCGNSVDDDQPEHPATISTYYLDAFEVTVGRFRNFVTQYDGTPPAAGAGAHPQIAGSGWQAAWTANLATSQAQLVDNVKCSSSSQTWTDSPGGNETVAINCVSWYEAFAFCTWDGGYLPTEAEWEYAAAGGSDNRLFPWGATDPSMQTNLANDAYNGTSPTIPVGHDHPQGDGKWGHRDLAGGMWEWVLDWYDSGWYAGEGASCNDCADLTSTSLDRVFRGGGWAVGVAVYLRAAYRGFGDPGVRLFNTGFRCARTP
jgi:sulfatase modifying factor 1